MLGKFADRMSFLHFGILNVSFSEWSDLSEKGKKMKKVAFILLNAAFLLLFSCATEKKIEPPISVPDNFSFSGNEIVKDKWWTSFDDPLLNKAVDTALSGNFSLKMYADRFRQARALAKIQGAGMFPSINGSVNAGKNFSGDFEGNVNDSGDNSISLSVSYEIDLWGKIRAQKKAAEYDLAASVEDFQAAAISLSAETVTSWYDLVGQMMKIRLLKRQMKTNSEYLELAEISFDKGSSSAADVMQQKQLLIQLKGELEQSLAQKKVLENSLAVLAGKPPQEFSFELGENLPDIPELPEVGIPAEIIKRRPDIKSAFFAVKSADRDLAAAIADRYPQINLSAAAGFGAPDITDLFTNWFTNLLTGITAPIFNGMQKKNKVEQNKAALQEKLNSYGNVILTALKEVEDALVQESKQGKYLDYLDKQLRIARNVTSLRRTSFISGNADYSLVLEALKNEQSLEKTEITAKGSMIKYRIALYKSIAGSLDFKERNKQESENE